MRAWLLPAVALAALACEPLNGDAAQCREDADCERFESAVCAVEQGVCVLPDAPDSPLGAAPETPASKPAPETPASKPAPLPATSSGPSASPSPCDAPNKPVVAIGAATGGGAVLTATTKLSCENDYLLRGRVVVAAGARLEIPAGTTVRGDAATSATLVVEPGGVLIARGTSSRPVVLTSSQPDGRRSTRDWTGVLLLGRAPPSGQLLGDPTLAWGGALPDDSSGELRYVRVEYATRGLQLGGVGRGTVMDHVQVRRSGGNCFEFRGGRVRAKYLACQWPTDEMFQFEERYDGALQYLVGQGTPAGQGDHHGLMVTDSRVTIANITLAGSASENASHGIFPRSGAALTLRNGLVTGWGAGLDVEGAPASLAIAGTSFFGQHAEPFAFAEDGGVTSPASPLYDDDNGLDERALLGQSGAANDMVNAGLASPFGPAVAPSVPTAASPGVAAPADPFFDAASIFRGGVAAGAAWTREPWVVWSAQ